MATTYKTPGVFIEEIPKLPPSVAQVETAIPAFIGYTAERGLPGAPLPTTTVGAVVVANPTRITSLLEYETLFGSAPLAVQLDVTGTDAAPVHVGSVTASTHTLYYHMQLYFANGGGPCYIVSVGDSDATSRELAAFQAGLTVIAGYDEPTLLVMPEADALTQANRNTLYTEALAQAALLQDRFVIMDVADGDVTAFRGISSNNLKYGAAYHPFLRTTLAASFSLANASITYRKDANADNDITDPEDSSTKQFGSLSVDEQAVLKAKWDELLITLPPSAAVAGAYAYVDSNRGVWKAPANVALAGVVEPTKRITDEAQRDLNVDTTAGKSINAIRSFTGKGTLIWGARTLAGNDNEWRYVPVRRFFNMVEESSKKATEPFVFEPNDANTWIKVQGMLENFLTTLWRQGALQGAKPEHAFYVAVGLNKTMTALDILEGRMIVEIGMAVVRPAEFIILRFSHKMAES